MLNRYRRHWSYNLSRNINLRFCTQWALEAHLSGHLSFTSCFQWPSERLNSSSADEAVLQWRTRRDDQPLLVSILRRRCLRRSVSVQWTAEATAKEEALAAACYRWPFLWSRPRRSTDAETNCSRLKCTGKISMQNLRFYSFRLMNTTCTMLSQRIVHPSFDCYRPCCSPFHWCSWLFGRTPDKAITRQPCILCGWSSRLEQSTTGHSFGTYIINFQKHAQDTSVLSFLFHWLNVSRVRAPNIVRRPCSD